MTTKKLMNRLMKSVRKQVGMPLPLAKSVVKAYYGHNYDKLESLGVQVAYEPMYYNLGSEEWTSDRIGVTYQGKTALISW